MGPVCCLVGPWAPRGLLQGLPGASQWMVDCVAGIPTVTRCLRQFLAPVVSKWCWLLLGVSKDE